MKINEVHKVIIPLPCELCNNIANYGVDFKVNGHQSIVYLCQEHIKHSAYVFVAIKNFQERLIVN